MAAASEFELDFCQLEAGEPTIKTTTTVLSSILVTEFAYDKAFHEQGVSSEGYVSFGFPQGNGMFRWAGKDVGPGYLMDFNGRSGYEAITKGSFSAKSIHVEQSRLHEIADVLGVDLSRTGTLDYGLAQPITPSKLYQMQVAIKNAELFVQSFAHQTPVSVRIDAVEEEIYRKLVNCLDISKPVIPVASSNRLSAMRRAIDFIKSNAREVITVTDVCTASATTCRTLERVFREEFNVTPKQYMKMVKLSGVRRDLSRPGQELNISDIALSWGILDLSHLAQDYKNYFSELPSHTKSQM